MKARYLAIAVTAGLLFSLPALHADDKDKGKEIARTENAKQKERDKETSRKTSPDKIYVPPPSRDRNNPTGDKDVQRGFDKHQKEHKEQKQKADSNKKPPA